MCTIGARVAAKQTRQVNCYIQHIAKIIVYYIYICVYIIRRQIVIMFAVHSIIVGGYAVKNAKRKHSESTRMIKCSVRT